MAFGRDFVRLEDYLASRLDHLKNPQKLLIKILSLVHYYGQQPIAAQAFCNILGMPPSSPLDMTKVLPENTLELLAQVQTNKWRMAHQIIAEGCLERILGQGAADRRVWKQGLSELVRDFISFCHGHSAVPYTDLVEAAAHVCIHREGSDPTETDLAETKRFSKLLEDIPSVEGRLEVLRFLVDTFPEEAHFWAHLGRFQALEIKDFEAAVISIDRAIGLQENDHLHHHMKGMALRSKVFEMIASRGQVEDVLVSAESASKCFARSRELAREDEHGYISDVQLIIRVIDYAKATYGVKTPAHLHNVCTSPWLGEAIDLAEDLLSQVGSKRQGRSPSGYEEECRANLNAAYGQYQEALQGWDSLLSRQDVHHPPVRRQIIRCHLAKSGGRWGALKPKTVYRSARLLEENLAQEPGNDRDLRLWLRCVRFMQSPPTIERVLEQVAYWKAQADTLEGAYYIFTLNALKSLSGLSTARDSAERALQECQQRSQYLRNRTWSFEWLGTEDGIRELVYAEDLGIWNKDKEFWPDTTPLRRVEGVISRIRGPQAGEIEVPGGLKAFFVPTRSRHAEGDENRKVSFFLGFSYDGLRAWSVENA